VVAFLRLVLLLSIVIWSIRRHRDPKLHIECSSPIGELIPSLRRTDAQHIRPWQFRRSPGERHFFDVLLEGIQAAEKSVHLETFLWKEGVETTAAEQLIDREIRRATEQLKFRIQAQRASLTAFVASCSSLKSQ
jgi:cardiolipin synthase